MCFMNLVADGGLSDTVTKRNLRARVKIRGKRTRGPCSGRCLSSEIQSRFTIAFKLKEYEKDQQKKKEEEEENSYTQTC